MSCIRDIEALLVRIYGDTEGRRACKRMMPLIGKARRRPSRRSERFSQGNMVLITYGDTLNHPGEAPLATFHRFAGRFLKEVVPCVHFLPFFPYSSDDGFSVEDYFAVDGNLGDWTDVARIGGDFSLMFDFVINHFSAQSRWFQNYLDGRSGFADMAIE
ncbi:MAG TPA: alpha-amylase family glycosyl hydrolase, partial [Desulfosarcina sp.]|nr:alpha-amylase family glycosyl hydrolase [Desulfosarcina sp.]